MEAGFPKLVGLNQYCYVQRAEFTKLLFQLNPLIVLRQNYQTFGFLQRSFCIEAEYIIYKFGFNPVLLLFLGGIQQT